MVSKPSFVGAFATKVLIVLIPMYCFWAGEANGAQLTVSWLDNTSGVGTTQVERRLGTDTTYAAVADVPPGATQYLDASVSAGTTYCYRAFAYDATSVSPYTDEVCTTSSSDPLSVTVSKTGAGTGTVASTPAGILCGTTCSATYPAGTSVALAATPDVSSTFTGWSSGGCSGTLACTIGGNTAVATTATFSLVVSSYTLTIATSGPGTVTSTPAGINCGADCSEAYARGTQVTLTAKPNSNGATFSGWSGGCAGSSLTCTVTMQAETGITAVFKKKGGPKSRESVEEEIPTDTPEWEAPPAEAASTTLTEASEIVGEKTKMD